VTAHFIPVPVTTEVTSSRGTNWWCYHTDSILTGTEPCWHSSNDIELNSTTHYTHLIALPVFAIY